MFLSMKNFALNDDLEVFFEVYHLDLITSITVWKFARESCLIFDEQDRTLKHLLPQYTYTVYKYFTIV